MNARNDNPIRRHTCLVDGHVHFHECFDIVRFVEGAVHNFKIAAMQCSMNTDWIGCLLLADTAGQDTLGLFKRTTQRTLGESWTFRATGEDGSLLACCENQVRLVMIAGRQIVTSEGVEVLALGCNVEVADGQPFRDTLQDLLHIGAIAVMPWGFGKWWFQRGRLVAKMLQSHVSRHAQPCGLFLGDNGGRLRTLPRPRLFGRAEKDHVYILPGSDPLPFASHERRAGSYGFAFSSQLDHSRPAEKIIQLLRDIDEPPKTFGRLEGPLPFIRNQVAMQLRKRFRRRHK